MPASSSAASVAVRLVVPRDFLSPRDVSVGRAGRRGPTRAKGSQRAPRRRRRGGADGREVQCAVFPAGSYLGMYHPTTAARPRRTTRDAIRSVLAVVIERAQAAPGLLQPHVIVGKEQRGQHLVQLTGDPMDWRPCRRIVDRVAEIGHLQPFQPVRQDRRFVAGELDRDLWLFQPSPTPSDRRLNLRRQPTDRQLLNIDQPSQGPDTCRYLSSTLPSRLIANCLRNPSTIAVPGDERSPHAGTTTISTSTSAGTHA